MHPPHQPPPSPSLPTPILACPHSLFKTFTLLIVKDINLTGLTTKVHNFSLTFLVYPTTRTEMFDGRREVASEWVQRTGGRGWGRVEVGVQLPHNYIIWLRQKSTFSIQWYCYYTPHLDQFDCCGIWLILTAI